VKTATGNEGILRKRSILRRPESSACALE
jgi:hypothetical protein